MTGKGVDDFRRERADEWNGRVVGDQVRGFLVDFVRVVNVEALKELVQPILVARTRGESLVKRVRRAAYHLLVSEPRASDGDRLLTHDVLIETAIERAG